MEQDMQRLRQEMEWMQEEIDALRKELRDELEGLYFAHPKDVEEAQMMARDALEKADEAYDLAGGADLTLIDVLDRLERAGVEE